MHWMTCLLFLMSAPAPENVKRLTSTDHNALFYPTWYSNTLFYENGLVLLLDGSPRNQEGLCLYQWEGRSLERLFCTTPRERFYNVRAAAIDAGGENLYACDYLTGLTFHYRKERGLRRYGQKQGIESLILHKGILIRGNQYPHHNLEPVLEEDVPWLSQLNRNLPSDADHDSQGQANENIMLLALENSRLAMGTNLYKRILIWDVERHKLARTIPIGQPFPGYSPPPDTYLKKSLKFGDKEYFKERFRWLESFSRLERLAWFEGRLMGFFRRGYEGYGIWVVLHSPGGETFFWDNNHREKKILGLGFGKVLMGRVEETATGEVVWSLWQRDSFPSS